MPVIRQKMIHREDLRANPDRLYVFGDNEQRRGMGGQAGAMRGEPNAVGVRTKRNPGMSPSDFWSDRYYDLNCRLLRSDFKAIRSHLRKGGTVVIPEDGLGTGLSELPTRAPQTYGYLRQLIALIEQEYP